MNITDAKPLATIYAIPDEGLPPVPTRFFGPTWANSINYSESYGVLAKAQVASHWSIRSGLFHSVSDSRRNYSDLYLDASSTGLAEQYLVA
jgi:hypothetical protein